MVALWWPRCDLYGPPNQLWNGDVLIITHLILTNEVLKPVRDTGEVNINRLIWFTDRHTPNYKWASYVHSSAHACLLGCGREHEVKDEGNAD